MRNEMSKKYNEYAKNLTLGELECFSSLTPDIKELPERGSVRVMLELPVHLLRFAREVCEDVNGNCKEEYGEDDWGLTPFDVLQDAYEGTDLNENDYDVVLKYEREYKEYMEEETK